MIIQIMLTVIAVLKTIMKSNYSGNVHENNKKISVITMMMIQRENHFCETFNTSHSGRLSVTWSVYKRERW